MLTYSQSSGIFERNGVLLGTGYAGFGVGKNNPIMQDVKDVGPIPQGSYTIQAPVDTKDHGPYVMWLTPDPGTEMFGRGGFGIHGDSTAHAGAASLGCIVAARAIRGAIWIYGGPEGHRLTVIP